MKTNRISVVVAGAIALAALAGWGLFERSRAAGPDPALEARVLAETIEEFEDRLAKDPRNPVVGARLVRDHLAAFGLDNDMHHLRRAEEIAEAQLPLALDRSDAWAALSAARIARHDFPGAHDAARRAVEADPLDAAALGTLYDAAIAVGEYAEAERALKGLIENHSGALGTSLREAGWLEAHGDAAEARSRFAPACARIEGRAVRRQLVAWCDVVLGGLAESEGDTPTASGLYERALDRQPGYMPALEGLAGMAYAESRWSEARALYLQIETDAHPDLQLRLAEIERALGMDESVRGREEAFLALTASPEARTLQAGELAVFLADDPATRGEALEVARSDLARRSSVEAWETLAWVLYRNGDLEEALEASDASRRWGAPGPTNDYTRARILAGLGRTAEAAELDDAVLADPAALDPHARWHHAARSSTLDSRSGPSPKRGRDGVRVATPIRSAG